MSGAASTVSIPLRTIRSVTACVDAVPGARRGSHRVVGLTLSALIGCIRVPVATTWQKPEYGPTPAPASDHKRGSDQFRASNSATGSASLADMSPESNWDDEPRQRCRETSVVRMPFADFGGLVLQDGTEGTMDIQDLVLLNSLGTDYRILDGLVGDLEARNRILHDDAERQGTPHCGAGWGWAAPILVRQVSTDSAH